VQLTLLVKFNITVDQIRDRNLAVLKDNAIPVFSKRDNASESLTNSVDGGGEGQI
jgi:hypothetical protein